MKSGWQIKTLGEVCDFEGGSQPPKSNFIFDEKPGYVRFLQIRDFGSNKNVTFIPEAKKNRLCQEADIMIGRYGASVGKILTGKAGAYNVALIKTIPNLKSVSRTWLHNYLLSDQFQEPLMKVASRSAQDGFSKEDIHNFPIPVPTLSEQQRIIAILDKAFEGIATAKANAEKNLQNAREIFESYLDLVFSQRGEGWEEETIGNVCALKSGTTVPVAIERSKGKIPYVKVAEMMMPENLDGVTTFIRFLDQSNVKSSWIIPAGATIFPKRGGAILTNKKRLVKVDMCADLNIMSVIPSEKITPEFLYMYFLTVDMRKLGSGSSIPQINNYDISPLRICFPKSKQKQREITERLRVVEGECQNLASNYDGKRTALDDLKKSLLHQAFSGQL